MTNVVSLNGPSSYGLKHVMRGELTKLSSLRSTYWTLLVTAVGMIGVTVLTTIPAKHHNRAWYQGFDPTNTALTGLAIGTLALGVLGVLAASGEYSSGTFRASLAAAPRRSLFLAGKTAVVGAIALVVGEVLTFACFEVGQYILRHGGAPSATLGQPGVLQAVILSGAFLALLGLLGLGLGVIIRHTAGAIAAYAGVTFVIPVLLQQLPNHPGQYSPVQLLADSVSAVEHHQGVSAPIGFLLMTIYTVGVLGVAAMCLARRDA
jgi:ABC-2 type transport system permease protein